KDVASVGKKNNPRLELTVEPFPKSVTATWEKAGADAGWLEPTAQGYLHFHTRVDDQPGETLSAQQFIPAFRLSRLGTGVLAGLKELAAFKRLRLLNIGYSQVTDAGMMELAGLTQLQHLDVSGRPVTDAALNHLAGLHQLQGLRLGYTQVTNTGLKELAGLKQ